MGRLVRGYGRVEVKVRVLDRVDGRVEWDWVGGKVRWGRAEVRLGQSVYKGR